MNAIIRAAGVSKRYRLGTSRSPYLTFREALVQALQSRAGRLRREPADSAVLDALLDVSFEVMPGEVVGIIGRNGAGKSTLLKILSRITEPSAGRIELYGRIASLLEVGTGFHPELTGRENIFLNGAILGMSRTEICRKFDEIVAFSEIEKFLDTPVKHYSSGMYVRLAFAVAAHLEPEILIVDEVLAVGDAAFQKKCLGKMSDVAREGRTVLFVSHNMVAVKAMCSRAILLDRGRVAADGPAAQVVSEYLTGGRISRAETVWKDLLGPGTDLFRLRSVRLRNVAGELTSELEASDPFSVEIEYASLTSGSSLGATVLLFNADGVLVFSSLSNQEAQWHGRSFTQGTFRSTCLVPGCFLPDGRYEVSVIVWANDYTVSHREDCVVEFEVHDDGSLRGDYLGPWEGVVRPRLEWRTEQTEGLAEGTLQDAAPDRR